MTKVIHIKDAPKGWKTNPDYVYIGRPSKWGNPFVIGKDGDRATVCERYFMYFYHTPELIGAVGELKDKILVCYCKPEECHGDILAEWANKEKNE
jgi:hypothetical protein